MQLKQWQKLGKNFELKHIILNNKFKNFTFYKEN